MDGERIISLESVIGHIGDYTDDAILITDAEPVDLPGPRIVWANKAFCRMTGYSLEDVIGMTPRILQGEDTDQAALARIREALKTWKPVRVELKNYRKDGSPFWVDLGIQPVTDKAGWHHFWVAVQRETTERHEREQLLTRTTRIIDSAPVALGLLTADNRLSFANVHFNQLLFGGRLPPALPLPYESWLRLALAEPEEPETPAAATQSAAEWITRHLGGLFSTPGRIEQRVQGRWHEFRRVATNAGEQLIIGEDIEDRMQLQEQLRHMTKLDAMGQLTSGVAHDFNNILAVILGNVELIQMEPEQSEDRDLFISETINAVLKGRSLTESLLSFARKSRLEPKSCRVEDLCRETIRMFRRTSATAIDITLDFPQDLHNILVDPNLFQNALLNLLINARDALPSGGTIAVAARPVDGRGETGTHGGEDPDQVEVSIRDNGNGMDASVVARAIEPFFTTKRAGSGSGLGLSMVHGFMQQSGGALFVNSARDAGTTISLRFLADKATPDEVEDPDAGNSLPTAPRILVVEDEKGVRALLVRILEKAGATVVAIESGDSAVGMQDRWGEFDLLMTDIVMPGAVQGDMLARQFADRCPDTPVILLSGNPELTNAVLSGGSSRSLVLSKPIQRTSLIGRIASLL